MAYSENGGTLASCRLRRPCGFARPGASCMPSHQIHAAEHLQWQCSRQLARSRLHEMLLLCFGLSLLRSAMDGFASALSSECGPEALLSSMGLSKCAQHSVLQCSPGHDGQSSRHRFFRFLMLADRHLPSRSNSELRKLTSVWRVVTNGSEDRAAHLHCAECLALGTWAVLRALMWAAAKREASAWQQLRRRSCSSGASSNFERLREWRLLRLLQCSLARLKASFFGLILGLRVVLGTLHGGMLKLVYPGSSP